MNVQSTHHWSMKSGESYSFVNFFYSKKIENFGNEFFVTIISKSADKYLACIILTNT